LTIKRYQQQCSNANAEVRKLKGMLAEANMRVKDISTSSDMISLDEHNVSITTKQPTASSNLYTSKPVPNIQGPRSHCKITSTDEFIG
jgi:hypothetical protein